MKMKKRILSVALALALGLSAAGCSKNDDAFELQYSRAATARKCGNTFWNSLKKTTPT